MRVMGWQTQRRNESEGRPASARVGSPPRRGSAPPARLGPAGTRRSESIHVGTRKMVNYAWYDFALHYGSMSSHLVGG